MVGHIQGFFGTMFLIRNEKTLSLRYFLNLPKPLYIRARYDTVRHPFFHPQDSFMGIV